MVYYILLFILILLLSSMGGGRAQRNKNLLFIVSAFFFFFAFRIGFTPDYYNYELGFMPLHNNMSIDVDGRTEIGYQWLCRIMPSYRFVLILFTLFFSVCMYIVFKDYIKTQYWPLAFTILFCVTPFVLGNMSGMRSGFVTCFFFLALIAKQKFKKEGLIIALGLIMAAYLFHRSALALAPLLIISGKPLGKFANYAVIILFGLIVYFAFRYANEINMLTLNFAHNVLERREYDTYFEEDTAYAFNLNGVIKIILLSVLAFLTLKSSNEEGEEYQESGSYSRQDFWTSTSNKPPETVTLADDLPCVALTPSSVA